MRGTRPTLVLCAEADTGIRRHGREAYPHEPPEHYSYADREGVVVTILCDSAERYLSERFGDE